MCRHDWLKWSELIHDDVRHRNYQYRCCAKCGKTQRRFIGFADFISPALINAALAATGFKGSKNENLPD